MTTIDGEKYITPREAADTLGITPQAIYRLIQRGTLTEMRPWPRFILIPERQVTDRLTSPPNLGGRPAGSRNLPITNDAFKSYLLERTEAEHEWDVTRDLKFDLAFEFIAERRRSWDRQSMRDFANRMSELMSRPTIIAPPTAMQQEQRAVAQDDYRNGFHE